MNDRLKIRVWDKYLKKYWHQEDIKTNLYWLLYPEDFKDGNYLPNCIVLEQCTGLKDDNGKLVYEGDILQDCEQRIRVVFDEQRYCFMFEYQNTSAYKPINCIDVLDSELEIVGNIHKNEEMLK